MKHSATRRIKENRKELIEDIIDRILVKTTTEKENNIIQENILVIQIKNENLQQIILYRMPFQHKCLTENKLENLEIKILPKHLTSIDEYIKYLVWVKREWKLLKFNWIRTWNKSENFNRSIRIRNKTKWHEAYNFIDSFKLILLWYELYQQLLFIYFKEWKKKDVDNYYIS